jgi:hypothetical protein
MLKIFFRQDVMQYKIMLFIRLEMTSAGLNVAFDKCKFF